MPVGDEFEERSLSFQSVNYECADDTCPTPCPEDAAFARELAGRVLEYVREYPAGTVEQLAVLVKQYLARRSA